MIWRGWQDVCVLSFRRRTGRLGGADGGGNIYGGDVGDMSGYGVILGNDMMTI